jgi:metal-responsive CopG/Arc/MetJ family transcriptional regulator
VRVELSVTLPKDLLRRIDQAERNRSAFLERAARFYLARVEKAARDAKDLQIINRSADRLNREAEDVLSYQRLRRPFSLS